MAWAVAAIVILSVGVPVAAWGYTRLRPPPPVSPLGTGYDQIDKWLLDRHELPPLKRARVRKAVGGGRRVDDPALAAAARDLATQILAGKFQVPRLISVLGWFNMMMATGFAALGVFLIVASRHPAGFAFGILGLLDCGLYTLVGVKRLRWLQQIRIRQQ
jgi:hypothetical protein